MLWKSKDKLKKSIKVNEKLLSQYLYSRDGKSSLFIHLLTDHKIKMSSALELCHLSDPVYITCI